MLVDICYFTPCRLNKNLCNSMYKYIYILQTLFENMERILHHTKKRAPDLLEIATLGVLIIWTTTTIWLLARAMTLPILSSITWESLQAIFTAFISITLLVLAVILADIRKELKDLYN